MSVTLPANGFVPRFYQAQVWDEMVHHGRKRAILCWPRRHGKDLLCLHIMATMALTQRVGAYYYVMPYQNQARRVIWNGIDGSGKRFIDAFPKELVESKNEGEMRLHLTNGSVFQLLGADDPDKLVGANPVGIVFSEYALTNPYCWKLVAPILAENDGWVLFNSTPRGNNHFRDMLEEAKARPDRWYWSHETAKTLKVLSPEDLRELRNELKDDSLFMQEAFCSFEAALQGSYYGAAFKYLERNKRFLNVPVDPILPVNTAWDLGVGDSTAIWFFQQHNSEVRVVDYYENSGEGLTHYARHLSRWQAEYGCTFGEHFGPHDLMVRELAGDGKTRLDAARKLGIRFRVVPRTALEDGVEAVRNVLPMCWFDVNRCKRGLDALRNYRKEWDPEKNVYQNRPVHDWTSHGADAFRYLAQGIKLRRNGAMDRIKEYATYEA